MNVSETVDFLQRLDRIAPAYAEWRSEQAARLAAQHGTDPTVEVREMIASVARSLADVVPGEVADVLMAIEAGEVAMPVFGDVAHFVRNAAMAIRDGRKLAAKYNVDATEYQQPRFQCLDCFDSGIVEIFNPEFVKAYRPEFDELPTPRPKLWFGAAYRWWLAQGRLQNPMMHVALCDCNCERARYLAQQLADFRRGLRKTKKGQPLGPPACGLAQWDRQQSPATVSRLFAPSRLVQWYQRRIA